MAGRDIIVIQNFMKGFAGFIPKRLSIVGKPELNNFPFNVLFGNFVKEKGNIVSCTALYEPNLSSYRKEKDSHSMDYINKYDIGDWLHLVYDSIQKRWTGEKFIKGKRVSFTEGTTWNMFFGHLTMLGLSPGERYLPETMHPPSEVHQKV